MFINKLKFSFNLMIQINFILLIGLVVNMKYKLFERTCVESCVSYIGSWYVMFREATLWTVIALEYKQKQDWKHHVCV